MKSGHIAVGVRVRVAIPDGLAEGEVVQVGGRLVGKPGIDPGWARVKLEDGRTVIVSEADLNDVIADS
jgi:hypothetical protein